MANNAVVNQDNVKIIRESWKPQPAKKDGSFTQYNVDQSVYTKLMKDKGIDRDVEDRIDQARTEIYYEVARSATEQLRDNIVKAKEEGRDPKNEEVLVNLRTPFANAKVSVLGAKKCHNPGTGEVCWTPHSVKLNIKVRAPIETEFHKEAQAEFAELCGVEFNKKDDSEE